MSSHLFVKQKHYIPAAHIRGLDRGARNNDSPALKLAVCQYTPKSLPDDLTGYFTLIVAHGIAFSKESYEPHFDDLLSTGAPIRSIWIADSVSSAESYRINQDALGDEVHWLDYARDIWQMINHFQAEMHPPLVGIGNSLGFGEMAVLSSWHPRLFAGIVAVDPALGPRPGTRWPAPYKWYPGVLATKRKDAWSSRQEAREALLKTAYYQKYDRRVFEKVMDHEIRDVDDASSGPGLEVAIKEIPSSTAQETTPAAAPSQIKTPESCEPVGKGVTLTTPKHIESYLWMLADPPLPNHLPAPEANNTPRIRRAAPPGFYRPESYRMFEALPQLYPPILLAWGAKSPHAAGWNRAYYIDVLGVGVGGNGGEEAGMVKEVLVDGAGHPVAQERPRELAGVVGPWLEDLKAKMDVERQQKSKQLPFRKSVHPEYMERIAKLAKL